MSRYIPARGDIIYIDLDPAVGREIQKRRPALVVSDQLLSRLTGFVLVCPITSTIRGNNAEVAIDGDIIRGVAISIQLKSLDYRERNIEFVEKADQTVVETMSMLLQELVAV